MSAPEVAENWNVPPAAPCVVHVDGAAVQNVEDIFTCDPIDDVWEAVPAAHAAGIPLYAQKLPLSSSTARGAGLYVAVRLMSEPASGLAPTAWQYGGANGDCPPVILARSDGSGFTVDDWGCLDDYLSARFDEGGFAVTPEDFQRYKKNHEEMRGENAGAMAEAEAMTEAMRTGAEKEAGAKEAGAKEAGAKEEGKERKGATKKVAAGSETETDTSSGGGGGGGDDGSSVPGLPGKKRTLKRDTALLREFDAGGEDPNLLVLYHHLRDQAFDCFNASEYEEMARREYYVVPQWKAACECVCVCVVCGQGKVENKVVCVVEPGGIGQL